MIDVHNTILRLPDMQYVPRTHEIESYANRILIERQRVQFLGASMLHDNPSQAA